MKTPIKGGRHEGRGVLDAGHEVRAQRLADELHSELHRWAIQRPLQSGQYFSLSDMARFRWTLNLMLIQTWVYSLWDIFIGRRINKQHSWEYEGWDSKSDETWWGIYSRYNISERKRWHRGYISNTLTDPDSIALNSRMQNQNTHSSQQWKSIKVAHVALPVFRLMYMTVHPGSPDISQYPHKGISTVFPCYPSIFSKHAVPSYKPQKRRRMVADWVVDYLARPPLVASRNSTFFFTTGSYLSMLRGRCVRGLIIVRKKPVMAMEIRRIGTVRDFPADATKC